MTLVPSRTWNSFAVPVMTESVPQILLQRVYAEFTLLIRELFPAVSNFSRSHSSKQELFSGPSLVVPVQQTVQ